jgi:hypothetical protein
MSEAYPKSIMKKHAQQCILLTGSHLLVLFYT